MPSQSQKGLLVHDSLYGATVEVAYWLKALIGLDQPLEVKAVPQVLTVAPYDYVVLGGHVRNGAPSRGLMDLARRHREALAQTKVAFFVTCGDTDETLLARRPGGRTELIGGRNYLSSLLEILPGVNPVAIGGFGGRVVMSRLRRRDRLLLSVVRRLSSEGVLYTGREIWESLIPERVEHFADQIRQEILGLPPRAEASSLRGFWSSQQPASLQNPWTDRVRRRPVEDRLETRKLLVSRLRLRSDLDGFAEAVRGWATSKKALVESHTRTAWSEYLTLTTENAGRLHVTGAESVEEPGHVHAAIRLFGVNGSRFSRLAALLAFQSQTRQNRISASIGVFEALESALRASLGVGPNEAVSD